MANVVTRHFETLFLVYDMTYSNIQDLMSIPSSSLFQKLLHRIELWLLKSSPLQSSNSSQNASLLCLLTFFLIILFFKFLPLNSSNSITSLSICELTMLTWVLSFRPDQIRLLMDIFTVYAKNPNKCFICLGAPWRVFLINSIMNFYVLNGNPMKRKQLKYFCDLEKKNCQWACSFFSC